MVEVTVSFMVNTDDEETAERRAREALGRAGVTPTMLQTMPA